MSLKYNNTLLFITPCSVSLFDTAAAIRKKNVKRHARPEHRQVPPYIASAGIKPAWPSECFVREKVIFTELTSPCDRQVNWGHVSRRVHVWERSGNICTCHRNNPVIFFFQGGSVKLKWPDWPQQQTCNPPLKSDESGGFNTVEPWSMSCGWACLCGPSWPSFVTQWLVSSSWSSLSSSTRPARFLPTKRRCQCSQRRSKRRPSKSTCWLQPDNDCGLKDNFRLQSICLQCWAFRLSKFFLFSVLFTFLHSVDLRAS